MNDYNEPARFEMQNGELVITDKAGDIVALGPADCIRLKDFMRVNYKFMRPGKNWSRCNYWNHADDCTCDGQGGDR